MDSNSNQHIVHAGWLMKSPPEKHMWKTKWRRRWFILKFSGQIPGQYVLEYYVDQSCKKPKGTIDLDQCEQVDAGLKLQIRKENFEHMFDLRTTKRVYYLVAKNEEEMNKWVECICAVCGLKMEAIPNEMSLLPSVDLSEERYSPQPSQSESHPQSTSESSLSTLNYIPISECYTGKPQSPPPPRPPKPLAIQLAKSQSSLALWPYEQLDSGAKPPPLSVPLKPLPTTVMVNDKAHYLNSNPPVNFYDTWHSGSMRMDRANLFPPPQVNRDLKPHRRRNQLESSHLAHPDMMRVSSLSSHMSLNRSKYPKIPSITSSYSLRRADDKFGYNHHSHFQNEQAKISSQPKSVVDNSVNEIQYLDLDLDSDSTNSQSPRTPQDSANNQSGQSDSTAHSGSWNIPCSVEHQQQQTVPHTPPHHHDANTVYKQVDFVKTQALNKMRLNVDLYRNSS